MEYMVAHASELPVEASFNLVPIPKKPKVCGFQGCKAEAVATGLYVPRNEEFLLCEVHLAEAKKRKDFQVSR